MKTLTLKLETIRTLSSSELDVAHGGGMQVLMTSSARKPAEAPVSSAKPAPEPAQPNHRHWSFSSVRRWL